MRGQVLFALFMLLAACDPPDGPNFPVSLQPPYNGSPRAASKAEIYPGKPFRLDRAQQQVVVTGITKWLKDPTTAYFGTMGAARNQFGHVTVCGDVDARNSAGSFVGKTPFIGVLMDRARPPEFVVVQIAAFGQARREVQELCQESGVVKG